MGMLDKKVVIVTGGGRGIGRAISLAMGEAGAKVVVNDIGTSANGEGADTAPAESVVEEIKAKGGEAVASTDSITNWDKANRIVEQAVDTYGRVDGVVNNAGILRDVIFHKMSESDWDDVLLVHLKGSFNVSRAAATHFRNQNGGFFIHMTSTTGLIGNYGQANYGAAKMGIVGLSKSIALDMKRFNVRSNCISPAAATRMTDTIPDDQVERKAKIAVLKPEKIAPLAVALGSDAAADVTGQVFFVRRNEIFLMSQARPIREMHTSDGWTPATVLERVLPAFRPSFYPLDVTFDVFAWEPT